MRLGVLRRLFQTGDEIPNNFDPADLKFVREFLRGGIIEILPGKRVRLTEEGRVEAHGTAPSRSRKPMEATETNLFVLKDLFKGADEIPNQLGAPDVPHVKRLLQMGYVELGVERKGIRLTAKGREALGR